MRRSASRSPRMWAIATATGSTAAANRWASISLNCPIADDPTVTTPSGAAGGPMSTRMLDRIPSSLSSCEVQLSKSSGRVRSAITWTTAPPILGDGASGPNATLLPSGQATI